MRATLTLVGILGCTGSAKEGVIDPADTGSVVDPLDWAVDQVGPFSVGHQSISHTYDPGDGLDDRTIRIDVWYPTQDESGITAEYAVGTDAQVMENAAVAAPVHDGGFPVHVHSHGYRGYGATSAFLARYFASHGWVTVAPGHTQNTIIDHVDPLPVAHFIHRPLDVTAALDSLTDIVPEADTSSVVLSGHSFGAYTTWASSGATYDLDSVAEMCATGEGLEDDGCTAAEEARFGSVLADPRVVATIPMAGTLRRSWFGSDGELSVEGPVLFFSGTEDSVGQQNQFDQMGAIDFTWVELDGGCHQTFALGGCNTLDTDLGFHVVQTLSLAFARQTVLEDVEPRTASLLSGEETISEITTTRNRLGR